MSTFGEGVSVGVRAANLPLLPVDPYHPPLVATVNSPPTSSTRASMPVDVSPRRENTHFKQDWNFNKANFPLLYSLIANVDWTSMYKLSLESSLAFFYECINSIANECAPKKKRRSGSSRYTYPEWYNAEIIHYIKFKYILHKRYKASESRTDYEAFAQCRAKVKRAIQIAEEQHYRSE